MVSKPVLINFLQALFAIVAGNVAYFLLLPQLPPVARHRPFRVDFGSVVDFWFCLVAYGLIRTARRWK
jgi:energy-converting hydrogenase Eha subunit A